MLGPVSAASSLALVLSKPIIGGLLIHRGVVWIRRRATGVVKIMRLLSSSDLAKRLKGLAGIVAHTACDRFKEELCRSGC